MDYSITARAREDLIGIWEYSFQNWSLDQADRYLEIMFERIKEICENPEIGKSYDLLRKGYWGLNIKSHIIFYRISDRDTIEIIRILHQRMDFQKRLNE